MKEIKTNGSSRAVIRRSFTSAHILCFANDSELINKSAYECKHSTLIHQLIQTAFKSIRLSYKEHMVDA